MIKKFLKNVFIGTVFMYIVSACCYAANLKATNEFFVNDFAGVLSSDVKTFVYETGKELYEKTTAQLVVTTVSTLEGDTIENFTLNVFRDFGIGTKNKNNGVMILLAPNERKVRVEVGYGLEGALNDSKVGRYIQNYANPYFKNNDWDSGIKELYKVLADEIYKEYEVDAPEGIKDASKKIEDSEDMISVIIVACILFIAAIWYFTRRKRNLLPFYNDDDDDNFHGGGFFSSGSSGGFSGFSGGGGSSGGGGASSSF